MFLVGKHTHIQTYPCLQIFYRLGAQSGNSLEVLQHIIINGDHSSDPVIQTRNDDLCGTNVFPDRLKQIAVVGGIRP